MINGNRIIKDETETGECFLEKLLKFRQIYEFIKLDHKYICIYIYIAGIYSQLLLQGRRKVFYGRGLSKNVGHHG